jgi:hypothetical protein
MSREHYVSAALWQGGSVDVVGFPWCKDKPKTVGLGSLTSKILCRTHNNDLSPLDAAAATAFGLLQTGTALANERGKDVTKRMRHRRFTAAEPWLWERWFLKTAINLCVVRPSEKKWRQTQKPLDKPPLALIELAFGLRSFERPMGLYTAASIGDSIEFTDSITFAPLEYGDEGMIGALFTFRGLRFVLHLEPHELPARLEIPTSNSPRWRSADLFYHLKRMNWNVGEKASHHIKFEWHLEPRSDAPGV